MRQKFGVFFLVGTIVAIVLVISSCVLLVLGVKNLFAERKNLAKARARLEKFYKTAPFAVERNVKREALNTDELKKWYSSLVTIASANQLQVTEQSRSKFMKMLSEAKKRIEDRARVTEVNIPSEFGFGFESYFAEESPLPQYDKVPRMVEQLIIIEGMCDVLIDNGVQGIRGIKREIFESDRSEKKRRSGRKRRGAGLRSNPDVGLLGKDDLYTKFSFRVEFAATEKTLVGVLNQLSSHELFFMPTHLQLKKEVDDVQSVARNILSAGTGSSQSKKLEKVAQQNVMEVSKIKPSSERLVCGAPIENPSVVILTFEVLKFQQLPEA